MQNVVPDTYLYGGWRLDHTNVSVTQACESWVQFLACWLSVEDLPVWFKCTPCSLGHQLNHHCVGSIFVVLLWLMLNWIWKASSCTIDCFNLTGLCFLSLHKSLYPKTLISMICTIASNIDHICPEKLFELNTKIYIHNSTRCITLFIEGVWSITNFEIHLFLWRWHFCTLEEYEISSEGWWEMCQTNSLQNVLTKQKIRSCAHNSMNCFEGVWTIWKFYGDDDLSEL